MLMSDNVLIHFNYAAYTTIHKLKIFQKFKNNTSNNNFQNFKLKNNNGRK